MVPRWKLERELRRIGRQINGVGALAVSPLLRWSHDLTKVSRTQITDGARPDGGPIALFLVYRPQGLLASHLHTLRHLVDKGLAPFLVVNHPLSPEDRARVAPLVWRVMERPNVGYDFGGYRDGILHLLSQGRTDRPLVVLNDSFWFPLTEDCTALETLLSWPEAFKGVSLHQRKAKRFVPHVQSFFFMFEPALLAHPDFARYWQHLLVSNNKQLVIRRLEMRMTEAMAAMGFPARTLFGPEQLNPLLAGLSQAELRDLVRDEWRMDNGGLHRLLSGPPDDPAVQLPWDILRQMIAETKLGSYILKLPPELMFDRLHFPLLKKDRHADYVAHRAILKERGYLARFSPVIRDEIAGWDG